MILLYYTEAVYKTEIEQSLSIVLIVFFCLARLCLKVNAEVHQIPTFSDNN